MTVTRDVAATRQRVWDVLADGWSYSGWVVGEQPHPRRQFDLACAWLAHPAFHRGLAGGDQ